MDSIGNYITEKLNNNHDNNKSSTNVFNTTTQPMDTNFKLNNTYILWHHDIDNKSWDIKSYNKLCTLETGKDFWGVFNFISQIGHKENNYYLMKHNTEPTWEHVNNRNGGACSIRVQIDDAPQVFQDLSVRMVCNILNSNDDDITGISCCPKNNWAIIKIWNKDKNNDLIKTLQSDTIKLYKSIGMRYKSNSPEY